MQQILANRESRANAESEAAFRKSNPGSARLQISQCQTVSETDIIS